MKKKVILLIGAGIIIGLSGFIVYLKTSSRKPVTQISGNNNPQPTGSPVTQKTWDDPAGFTFLYPEGIQINKHDEDNENYAHIEFTDKKHPGGLIIWAKDTTASDAKEWAAATKVFKDANIIDTTFGGQPGIKVVITSPQKKVITGAIYDGLLFYIETDPGDSEYWININDAVTGSFVFKPAGNTDSGSTDTSGTADNGGNIDEEETLE